MKSDNSVHIAVIDTSVIVRSGMAHVIKHMPDNDIYVVEIGSVESLSNYLSLHTPDVVIVNPMFDGWFNIVKFKADYPQTRFVALMYSVIDPNLLKDYDAEVSICDEMELIIGKLNDLLGDSKNSPAVEQTSLSQREREIIVCVVKGMTNKEIAEKLFLSIHTVVTHRRNIARKLQIHSPAGLTIYAIVNKLVDIQDVKAL